MAACRGNSGGTLPNGRNPDAVEGTRFPGLTEALSAVAALTCCGSAVNTWLLEDDGPPATEHDPVLDVPPHGPGQRDAFDVAAHVGQLLR